MKVIDTKCPHCGGEIKYEKSLRSIKCDYCSSILYIDNEKESKNLFSSYEEAGYNFEKGRQRARKDNLVEDEDESNFTEEETSYAYETSEYNEKPEKKRNTFLWLMGWLFMFPIPATILIARNENMTKAIKAILIVTVWLFYLSLGQNA